MMIALLIAGIVAIVGGILTIVYGILLELSLGNSLIVTGTIALCSGLILLGLHAVVGELKIIARRLGSGAAAEPRVRPVLPPAAAEGGFLFGRDQAPPAEEEAGNAFEPAVPMPPPAQPWREEAGVRERTRQEPPALQPLQLPQPPGAAAAKPRRNLLFASTSRRERERAQERPQDRVQDRAQERPHARAAEPAPEERAAPPVMPAPEPVEPAPSDFEDSWSRPERSRPDELAPQRRAGRTPSTFAEPEPEAEPLAETPYGEEMPGVTVIKSGVVDGMAYSLYSDGSIEAQMPEGMMRFASIDELRAHLDQRG